MSYLQALLVADARRLRRAQRSATHRHRHLTKRPLGLLLWQLGAEPFTAAAVAWGFGPDQRKIAVPGEPRDRELAFRALTIVARDFNAWFEGTGRDEPPQIVVANRATLALLARLGRRLAYLPTTGAVPADPELVRFGRHLRFLADRARHPGQQLVVVLTDLLASHWVTELSALEMQQLPALDAAIEPPRGQSAHEAAREAERTEIGPVPAAEEDGKVDDLLSAFNAQRGRKTEEKVVAPLRKPIESHYGRLVDRGWPFLWRCLERERGYPEAAHVGRRWKDDLGALDRHLDWVVTKGGHQRTRQTNAQAAWTLRAAEDAVRLLEAEEAIDDPLRMLPTLLANQGLVGKVRRVDRENYEQGPKRQVRRPLVELETAERCVLPTEKELWWTRTADKREYVITEVRHIAKESRSIVVLQLETSAEQELPTVGETAIFSVHHLGSSPPLKMPKKAPWTHREPEQEDVLPALDGATDEGRWE
ncbi:hypothetical protein [Chondromyces crocatus]|uniref:Uncharacterized protein n=1 Tax=Chondromyces crocatus TaxID=52 RepID=A0A0K1EBA9_CHOCO|nr:hypothetical protein [Chondromyces crocatus]AKT38129.1 uncharacterized protein CMC5_022710 [Chondromyces crocatus]